MDLLLDELDAAGLLAVAVESVWARRLVEVRDLEVLSRWVVLHSGDPTEGPGGVFERRRGNVLRVLGGEGTPGVQDFCLGEIAMTGVTRVEGLGPQSLAQLRLLLAGDQVVVKPVIDLAETGPLDRL